NVPKRALRRKFARLRRYVGCHFANLFDVGRGGAGRQLAGRGLRQLFQLLRTGEGLGLFSGFHLFFGAQRLGFAGRRLPQRLRGDRRDLEFFAGIVIEEGIGEGIVLGLGGTGLLDVGGLLPQVRLLAALSRLGRGRGFGVGAIGSLVVLRGFPRRWSGAIGEQ